MLITQVKRVTCSAFLAVKEILLPSHPANTAFIAMKLPLRFIIIEEPANLAEVLPHANPAVGAHLRNRLLGVADGTDHLVDIMAAELVVVGVVVAVAAGEGLVAAGGADHAPPAVVLAAVAHLAEAEAVRRLHLRWMEVEWPVRRFAVHL